jgi:hypothetical protein
MYLRRTADTARRLNNNGENTPHRTKWGEGEDSTLARASVGEGEVSCGGTIAPATGAQLTRPPLRVSRPLPPQAGGEV